MSTPQPAILAPLPPHGRTLVLSCTPGARREDVLGRLRAWRHVPEVVVGLGAPLAPGVPGLLPFPVVAGPGGVFPSTQGALVAFVGGSDPGVALHRARALVAALGDAVTLDEDTATFQFDGGRDLTGYVDGTENPKGEAAAAAALVAGAGPGLDGSSFVAVQRWVHALAPFEALPEAARDHVIGRSHATDEELEDAPASAHVKRTAQESFEPAAFMLRRSMPWGSVREHGLVFVAYGKSLDAFVAVLRRMAGAEDGIADALLTMSRPVTGGAYWCPPLRDGALDLRALG